MSDELSMFCRLSAWMHNCWPASTKKWVVTADIHAGQRLVYQACGTKFCDLLTQISRACYDLSLAPPTGARFRFFAGKHHHTPHAKRHTPPAAHHSPPDTRQRCAQGACSSRTRPPTTGLLSRVPRSASRRRRGSGVPAASRCARVALAWGVATCPRGGVAYLRGIG